MRTCTDWCLLVGFFACIVAAFVVGFGCGMAIGVGMEGGQPRGPGIESLQERIRLLHQENVALRQKQTAQPPLETIAPGCQCYPDCDCEPPCRCGQP
jgi:hypothetical protein